MLYQRPSGLIVINALANQIARRGWRGGLTFVCWVVVAISILASVAYW